MSFVKKHIVNIITIILIIVCFSVIIASIFYIASSNQQNILHRGLFNIAMAIVLIGLVLLPKLFMLIYKVKLTNTVQIIYLSLATIAFLFGEIFDFYLMFFWWDGMLHFSVGFCACMLGVLIFNCITKDNKLPLGFVILLSMAFSVSGCLLWEILEFIIDSLIGTNMQRYKDSITKVEFVGQMALIDTMKDLILDLAGAFICAIVIAFDTKLNKSKFTESLRIERK